MINVHKLFNIPQKLICPLKKNCRLHRHAELLKITGSHLRAVRKAVEHLSFSLGGWLHVVDTFASSKMHTDKLNICENVWAACGKPQSFLWRRGFLPLSKTIQRLRSFICQAVASTASCKQVAWTGCTENSCCVPCSTVCPAPNRKRRCKKVQIRSHYTATNMTGTVLHIIWAPRLIHSVSLPMSMNNTSRVCIVLQSRRLLLWIGGKLQKRPVQIRRDGFIIRLKCQLLQKPIPRLHSRIDALNFQLFLPNRCNHCAVKQSFQHYKTYRINVDTVVGNGTGTNLKYAFIAWCS